MLGAVDEESAREASERIEPNVRPVRMLHGAAEAVSADIVSALGSDRVTPAGLPAALDLLVEISYGQSSVVARIKGDEGLARWASPWRGWRRAARGRGDDRCSWAEAGPARRRARTRSDCQYADARPGRNFKDRPSSAIRSAMDLPGASIAPWPLAEECIPEFTRNGE